MKPKSIMIADDDEDLLFLLKSQFTSLGYIVNSCLKGKSIIEKLIKEKPNIILLDVNMQGIDGDELCRQIKKDKRFSKIKILIMSGEYDVERISLSCGADGYIRKPLSYSTIQNKISTIFSEY